MNSILCKFPLYIQLCILEYYNHYKNIFSNTIIELKWNNFNSNLYSIIPKNWSIDILKRLKNFNQPTTQPLRINIIPFDLKTIKIIKSVIPYLCKKTKKYDNIEELGHNWDIEGYFYDTGRITIKEVENVTITTQRFHFALALSGFEYRRNKYGGYRFKGTINRKERERVFEIFKKNNNGKRGFINNPIIDPAVHINHIIIKNND